jgi:hypothetical protein
MYGNNLNEHLLSFGFGQVSSAIRHGLQPQDAGGIAFYAFRASST